MRRKIITPEEIQQLTRKLSSGRDIDQDEANSIKRLFSENMLKTKLNRNSSKYDRALSSALAEWYRAVYEALYNGRTGAFTNTIYLHFCNTEFGSCMFETLLSLKERVKKNKTDFIKVAQAVSFPLQLSKAIEKETSAQLTLIDGKHGSRYFYGMLFGFQFDFYDDVKRSGLYPFVKDYVPIVSPDLEGFFDENFYLRVAQKTFCECIRKEDLKKYAIATAIEEAGIETMFLMLAPKGIRAGRCETFLCAREKDVPLILSWAEVPTEDIIGRLLQLGEIAKRDAKTPEEDFFRIGSEAITAGAKIIKKLAQIKRERENINEFDNWMEITR